MQNNRIRRMAQASLFKIIAKIMLYGLGLVGILWYDGIYEMGTQVSCVSSFLILSTVLELLFNKHCVKGYRYTIYLLLIAGIFFSGMFLIKEANQVKKCDQSIKMEYKAK